MGPFIHVLYIQSPSGWYAQCLDYDVGAQGKTQEEAERAFFATWHLQAQIDRESGRQPFAELGRAPDKFFEMAKGLLWSQKDLDVDADDDSSEDLSIPPAYMLTTSMTKRDSVPSSIR